MFKNRIVGLMRFSYPALSGFTSAPTDPAALSRYLYDPARLDRRFALFETLALPSLLAQTDPDFEMLFLIGADLPSWARDRLAQGIAPLRARLIALPPMHHYPAIQSAYATLSESGHSHVTSFRLDDDDALDRAHIARIRRIAVGIASFTTTPFAIAHNRGLFLDLRHNPPRCTEVTEKMPLGIGLALCAPVAERDTIFRRNHRLLPQFFTTFSDATEMAFLRTIHDGNDSNAHNTGVVTDLPPPRAAALLGTHFATDLPALTRLAKTLSA